MTEKETKLSGNQKPKDTEKEKDELTEAELEKAAGGINPQPLPPRTPRESYLS